jgi:hypothetical protein
LILDAEYLLAWAVWWAEALTHDAPKMARRHWRVCGRIDHAALVLIGVMAWSTYDAWRSIMDGDDDESEG